MHTPSVAAFTERLRVKSPGQELTVDIQVGKLVHVVIDPNIGKVG